MMFLALDHSDLGFAECSMSKTLREDMVSRKRSGPRGTLSRKKLNFIGDHVGVTNDPFLHQPDRTMAVPQFWFLETCVSVRISGDTNKDHISVLEHRAYHGDSPPLHIHHTEDEVFVVLEGEFRLIIGSDEHRLRAGQTILAPKGVPHQYRVESIGGGRWLTITTGHDFENFVKAVSRPAERDALPDRSGPPTEEMKKALAAASLTYNIEIVGPPLHSHDSGSHEGQ